MKKNILFVIQYTYFPNEAVNGRFHYIADKISKTEYNVEVVTTNFNHITKKKRDLSEINQGCGYNITLLDEPGYKKNISHKRIVSHRILSNNLDLYLRERMKPDLIYCAVPSLNFAHTAVKYAKEFDIKIILDIQDLWPEAFKMVFNIPIISSLLYYPMEKLANFIYSSADELIAVSRTYLDRALEVNKKVTCGYDVFLGTDLREFDKYAASKDEITKNRNEFWIAYIGTLSHSYDIPNVLRALKYLIENGYTNIKFILVGDGPLKLKFERMASKLKVNTYFTGYLSYREAVKILSNCDIAVNPIVKGSAGSVINKVGDYAAASLPVVNSQESIEYRNLLTYYQAGLNCKCEDYIDIAEKIEYLILNESIRSEMSMNSRKLAVEKFDREQTYNVILEKIKGLLST